MNETLLRLKLYLRLLALKALPDVERRALEVYERTGVIVKDKEELAVQYGMERYAQVTAKVPGLNATTLDDLAVETMMREAVRWAWGKLGVALNEISHDPEVRAPELPQGGEAQ